VDDNRKSTAKYWEEREYIQSSRKQKVYARSRAVQTFVSKYFCQERRKFEQKLFFFCLVL
jgi:hypothetical protein